jgi:hypothetical protein
MYQLEEFVDLFLLKGFGEVFDHKLDDLQIPQTHRGICDFVIHLREQHHVEMCFVLLNSIHKVFEFISLLVSIQYDSLYDGQSILLDTGFCVSQGSEYYIKEELSINLHCFCCEIFI